jgi:hypothetical protein
MYPDLNKMPKPSLGGMIFNIIMLFTPFIGFFLFGISGLFVGLTISSAGLFFFFFIHKQKGTQCEICKRSLINLGRGSQLANSLNIGTFFSVSNMRAGGEGPGDECLKCGRIYCTRCAQYDMTCKCGSKKFRTVRLQYK